MGVMAQLWLNMLFCYVVILELVGLISIWLAKLYIRVMAPLLIVLSTGPGTLCLA